MMRRVLYTLFILVLGLGLPGGVPASTLASELLVPTAPQVELGEPGMSFAYDHTYGSTRVPYPPDTDHLNRPAGLFIDAADKLYVTEDVGQRLLRYDLNGTEVMAIGRAGVCDRGEYSFCGIRDAVADEAGNIWVADGGRVAKYDADGNYILTLEPEAPDYSLIVTGVALDSDDHLFVSDAGRERILVYDISGPTPTYHSMIGVTDTPGSAPGFLNGPKRIVVDSQDRVIIVEGNAYQLGPDDWRAQRCSYTSSWNCEVVATGLYSPQGVTVDDSDIIYIADSFNSRIRRCTAPNACTDFVSGTYGLFDLAFDSAGYLFATAAGEHVVVKYNQAGTEIGYAYGEYGVPYITDGYHYNVPRVTLDGDDNIIIIEESGQRLVKLDPEGNFLWDYGVPGVEYPDNDHLNWPYGAATDADSNIYVADGGCRVQIIDADGNYLDTFGGTCGDGDYEFGWITGIAVGANGWLYVSDADNHRVQIYDETLTYVDTIGETGVCGTGENQLCKPWGVEVDAAGNIYVADGDNRRVQVFDSMFTLQLSIGVAGEPGNDFDHFAYPNDVAVDVDGNIYVSDCDNHRVQVFDPTGAYLTTIGGRFGENTSQFAYPSAVALDSQGNLFVAERDNHRIQRFTRGVPGWTQANLNGFGSRWVEQIPSLEVFNEVLYAGTSNYNEESHHIFFTADGQNWQEVSHEFEDGISTLQSFKGFLYAGTWNGLVWRSEDGLNWTNVFTSPQGFASFSVLDNVLYAGTYCGEGTTIYQTTDGLIWTPFVTGGNGDPNADATISSATFKNLLYFGVADWSGTGGGRIWRTDGTDVTEVVSDGFGDPLNMTPGGLTTFADRFYASISNPDSFQVWRSDSGDEDSWEMVFEFGLGESGEKDRTGLIVYNSQLFLTAQNDWSGMTVWRTLDGLTWQQVGFGGFGDSNNVWTEWGSGIETFDGRLFIGVNNYGNGGEVWTYDPNILWLPLMSKTANR
jgi:sugar lactone lactonase YvrE